MHNIIAVVFDFDDTLAPDSTSSFLESRGIDVKSFWKSVDPLLKDGWDPVPAYLYKMIEESSSRPMLPITQKDLRMHGSSIRPFAGVTTIFGRIQKHVNSVNPNSAVEFYMVSSGIGEILRASKLSSYFKEIWACDFYYGNRGEVLFPKNIVSFTDKTRYLFHIAKGVIGPEYRGKPFEVNRKVKEQSLRIPFCNMVYVGDGYTDIPCFSLVKKNDGMAIGVYDKENREKWGRAWGFAEDGRVSNLVPADYSKNSALANSLLMATESIAKRIKLHAQIYQG